MEKLQEILEEFQQTASLDLANSLVDNLYTLLAANEKYLKVSDASQVQKAVIQILDCSRAIRIQHVNYIPMIHTQSRTSSTGLSEPFPLGSPDLSQQCQYEPLQQTLFTLHDPIKVNLFAPDTQDPAVSLELVEDYKTDLGPVGKYSPSHSTLEESKESSSSENSDDEEYNPDNELKGAEQSKPTSNTLPVVKPAKKRIARAKQLNLVEATGGTFRYPCNAIQDLPFELTPQKKLLMYEWVQKNYDDPYLTQSKKVQFSYLLQLSITQVEDFFSNTRRRIVFNKKKAPNARMKSLMTKMKKIQVCLNSNQIQIDPTLMQVLMDGGAKSKATGKKGEADQNIQDE
ncbi:hypothetical protein HDV01_006882 [Terramyces sp. JEL0728]|nr:hypothetical protein HDV01_006882 [Terramyces sp. JEL0728]